MNTFFFKFAYRALALLCEVVISACYDLFLFLYVFLLSLLCGFDLILKLSHFVLVKCSWWE